ncbi:MAG: PRC-barrel domain-containing protein [Firmicutes bacterium]|jgi:uncharacterized protein YrrD|uniref:PRC-barrel domain-containing protein n=1 Tax=Sulfobacillus benefaciens TaxID=453960 RepID=A0A2T2WX60_9FIRM|nr:PRC-barrel domain-containing protein [Bacillota bacterium]MCL5014043.1 PRC-barrel domain-containing protein [Bacillota bacterium]PSR26812.1 MAG: hypothetical protein C7B43_13025 [Sulfobacillus benefaciens]
MVSRWHLLHLPVTLQGKTGPWGWVEDVLIRWPEGVIEGVGVRTAVRRYYVPATTGSISITNMGVRILKKQSVGKRSRSWWKGFGRQKIGMNHPVFGKNGEIVGLVKDLMIDETSLAVHDIVVSRGILEDLTHGALLVSTREVQIDLDGRIKIVPNRAV